MRPTALQSSLWPSQLILDNHSTYPTQMYQRNIHTPTILEFFSILKVKSSILNAVFLGKKMTIVQVRLFGRWEYLYQSYHHILIDHNFIRAYRHYRSCLNANTKKYRLIQPRGSINSYTPTFLMVLPCIFVAHSNTKELQQKNKVKQKCLLH